MLELKSISGQRNERSLFQPLSLKVQGGEWIQIMGSNGSGKTTLLRMLAGLYPISEGDLYWNHQDCTKQRAMLQADLLYLGHQHGLHLGLSPFENLNFFVGLQQADPPVSVDTALKKMGLFPFKNRACGHLSLGQRQRVALSRLLLSRAKVWLLDEPCSGLDAEGVEILQQCLKQHVQKGGLALVATHQKFPGATETLNLHTQTR